MMMTEKYYTLPPSSSSLSPSSLFYHSTKTKSIRELRTRLYASRRAPSEMKLPIEHQPLIPTYDVQNRIDYFEKKKQSDDECNEKVLTHSLSTTGDTLQTVIANTLQQTFFQNESYGSALSRTMINSATNNKRRTYSSSQIYSFNDHKRSTKYSSLLAKRVRTYSLSNHATMAITATTSFSEEQTTEPQETTTMDYENTYFYPEETTRLDDVISLTTITPNLFLKTTKEIDFCSDTTVSHSDSEETSEELTPIIKQYDHTYVINSSSYENLQDTQMEILPPIDDRDFTGLVHARKCRIIEEKDCLSSYDNVNHYCAPNTIIRSKADNVSLNPMMIISSSIEEDHYRTNSIETKQRVNLHEQNLIHSKQLQMIIDDDDDNESDGSNYSEDFRYSSDAARSSCTSDDLNNTSSTLRQEAISITRVRCKRRKTWIRSPSSPTPSLANYSKTTSPLQQRRLKTTLIEPFLSTNSIAGTDVRPTLSVNSTSTSKATLSTVLNQTRVKSTPIAMLLHNNSLNCQKNAESFSYDFMTTNTDHHESSSVNISNTLDKDISSPKTNKKLTEFPRSSLSPVKRLLNESLDSNIEVIQMDEQECILEIVDGVLTIVPRDKSSSSSIGEVQNSHSSKHINTSKRQKQRSSSVASSVSTPSLSEHDHERSSSKPLPSPPLPIEQPIDVLDLFSTPINPSKTNTKTLLFDDSLSSVSSSGERPIETKKASTSNSILRSSSPINHPSKSSSIKDTSKSTVENQTRSNKNTLLTQLLQTVKKASPTEETESEKSQLNTPLPKPSAAPTPRPINKDRINEFASLLSSSVHLSQPQLTKTPIKTSTEKKRSSSTRSDEPNSSSLPSANIDGESHPEQEPIKRHIDARYTEKLDDRGSIKINTANIKALFEQKISDTNKVLSQSTEHLSHIPETRSHHKKVPVSYRAVKKDLPPPVSNQPSRRRSYQEPPTMMKLPDPINTAKDVVIEDKQSENGVRRHTADQMVRSSNDSPSNSPVSMSNGYYSESLIAREIRETKEKEEELKRQRKKCGLEDDASTPLSQSINDSIKSESSNPPTKSSSFISNLDFFTSKLNAATIEPSPMTSSSPRRSTIATHNLLLDLPISSRQSSNDEFKQMTNVVSQELNRFNENGVPILRTSSTNGLLHRSASNQNIHATPQTSNIIQREIAVIRAKETELRESGRIQHTSDEHADPRKYQELVPILPKSQSINPIPSGKKRRDSENQYLSRQNGSSVPMTNGFSKPNHNNTPTSSVRGKFPTGNPSAPVVSTSNKSIDSSKLSTTDRLELEKRQCQQREQELKKQRHSIVGCISSTNTTINGDSGNVSQEEHDDDQERYFDKIERLKRTQNQKAQAPLIRPTKKSDMSQKWEQMMANKLDD